MAGFEANVLTWLSMKPPTLLKLTLTDATMFFMEGTEQPTNHRAVDQYARIEYGNYIMDYVWNAGASKGLYFC
jgi:hypothetical protein